MIKGFAKDTLPWPLRNSGLFRHVQVLSELLGSSGSPRHVAPLNNPPPPPPRFQLGGCEYRHIVHGPLALFNQEVIYSLPRSPRRLQLFFNSDINWITVTQVKPKSCCDRSASTRRARFRFGSSTPHTQYLLASTRSILRGSLKRFTLCRFQLAFRIALLICCKE